DFILFFFSSRRRHTRSKRDWSSDVCSSDLTILGMPRTTEVLILEMGMSDRKEIERLAEIAKPDYAIITNIGESHIEFLGSRQAKIGRASCRERGEISGGGRG